MNQFSESTRPGGGFLDLPAEYRDPVQSRVAILPVPYDETSSWKKGSRHGPNAIIEASAYLEVFDIETQSEPWRQGIVVLDPIEYTGPPEPLIETVATRAAIILENNQLPVVLGGEHTVTIGAVRAARERFGDLSVLQIDAHGDTREQYQGSRFSHACVMARVREMASIVQVGIRSLDTPEWDGLDRDRVFFAHDIAASPHNRPWMERVIDRLSDEVYITMDLDAFDPSVMPATTPEPGGLFWADVNALVRALARSGKKIVGFDVVELLPTPGLHHCEFTAAKLVYRTIAEALAVSPK